MSSLEILREGCIRREMRASSAAHPKRLEAFSFLNCLTSHHLHLIFISLLSSFESEKNASLMNLYQSCFERERVYRERFPKRMLKVAENEMTVKKSVKMPVNVIPEMPGICRPHSGQM